MTKNHMQFQIRPSERTCDELSVRAHFPYRFLYRFPYCFLFRHIPSEFLVSVHTAMQERAREPILTATRTHTVMSSSPPRAVSGNQKAYGKVNAFTVSGKRSVLRQAVRR